MKTIIIILIAFISSALNAQSTDTSFNYNDDYILRKIIPALPMGWTFSQQKGEFIIDRTDSVTIVDKRILKIPNYQKVQDDTILKYGHKAKSVIIYKYDNRWTIEKTLSANTNNIEIYQQLNKLPDKYGITDLLDKSKSSRGNNVYTGNTEKEKQLIKQFEAEKNELLSKLILMPYYNTEKYSLFLKSTYGCIDDFYSVYPSKASLELYQILALFSELTEKNN
jgi:hypothetical protein